MKNKYRKMKFDVGMDAELNERLQLKLFEEGYTWGYGEQTFHDWGPYIYTDADGSITWEDGQKSFDAVDEYMRVHPHFYLGTTVSETEDLIEIL